MTADWHCGQCPWGNPLWGAAYGGDMQHQAQQILNYSFTWKKSVIELQWQRQLPFRKGCLSAPCFLLTAAIAAAGLAHKAAIMDVCCSHGCCSHLCVWKTPYFTQAKRPWCNGCWMKVTNTQVQFLSLLWLTEGINASHSTGKQTRCNKHIHGA